MKDLDLDPERLERAINLMANGTGVMSAAKTTGLSEHLLRCYLNPDYRRRRALSARKRRLERNDEMKWRQKYPDEHIERRASPRHVKKLEVPNDILYERDQRLAIPHRDFTAEFMGDPRPGYSALDRKRKVFR